MNHSIEIGRFFKELATIDIKALSDEQIGNYFAIINQAVSLLERAASGQPELMPLLQGYRDYRAKFLEEMDKRNIHVVSEELLEMLDAAVHDPGRLWMALRKADFDRLVSFSKAMEEVDENNPFRKLVLPFVNREITRRGHIFSAAKGVN